MGSSGVPALAACQPGAPCSLPCRRCGVSGGSGLHAAAPRLDRRWVCASVAKLSCQVFRPSLGAGLCRRALREFPQPLQQGLSCEEGSPSGCLAIFHPGTHLPHRTESCHNLSWDSGPAKALGRKLGRKHEAGPAPGAVGQGHNQGRGQGQGHQVGDRPPVHTLSQRPRMAMRPQGPCHH